MVGVGAFPEERRIGCGSIGVKLDAVDVEVVVSIGFHLAGRDHLSADVLGARIEAKSVANRVIGRREVSRGSGCGGLPVESSLTDVIGSVKRLRSLRMEGESHGVGSILGRHADLLRVVVVERLQHRELVVGETHIAERSLSTCHLGAEHLVAVREAHSSPFGVAHVGIDRDGECAITALVYTIGECGIAKHAIAPSVWIAIERAHGIAIRLVLERIPSCIGVAKSSHRLTVEQCPVPCLRFLPRLKAINIVSLDLVDGLSLGGSQRANGCREHLNTIVCGQCCRSLREQTCRH